ncbi:hypothetical protein H0H93_015172 [Arthromyces matolae]|nr:hypothetical protein H0H93_015172 [Arthromyces matolae]
MSSKTSWNVREFGVQLDNVLIPQVVDHTLSPPDFMIVHPFDPLADRSAPLELHGFPPWQQETSAAHLFKYIPLTEDALSRALDQFSAAEMRFGK